MSASRPAVRVLFRVAGGPRQGFGHIVRSVRLARALGVVPALSVRGAAVGGDAFQVFGAVRVEGDTPARCELGAFQVLVVDDPNAAHAHRWVRAARRAGLLTVSVHDLGRGTLDADFQIDGSLGGPWASYAPGRSLVGPRYALVDPLVVEARARRLESSPGRRVLVALGGGRRQAVAEAMVEAIARRCPSAEIHVAGGFAGLAVDAGGANVTCLPPLPTLAWELATADVAVVAAGVTAYETAAIGVPTVAGALVPSQRPTLSAFSERGAVADGGDWWGDGLDDQAAATATAVAGLMDDPRHAALLARRGRALVDGLGVARVAGAIAEWAEAA